MTDRTFDTNQMLSAAREAFAPMFKAQQEGFKTFERLARLNYVVAGDVLELGFARVNAALAASSPTELFTKHTELSTQFVDKLRARAEEFSTVTSEIQAKFSQLVSEIAAKAVPTRKAARYLGPHYHVLARHLGEWRHRRLERLGHLRLQHVLLAQERADALLEVRGEHLLDGIAVETDDRLQQLGAEHRRTELLLTGDDLQQDAAGDVLAALVVHHFDALTACDQLAQVIQGHVAAVMRVVQPTIGVFAYEAFFGHVRYAFEQAATRHRLELGRRGNWILALVYAAHNDVFQRSERPAWCALIGRFSPDLRDVTG